MIERFAAGLITLFARFVTAVRAEWRGFSPDLTPRIYFANHTSNGDFVLVWTVLPGALRERTRPVAAADYWRKDGVRRFIGERVFKAVLIERHAEQRTEDPILQMAAALDQNASLIIFPEGTRNLTELPLLPLKSGIYRLALLRPGRRAGAGVDRQPEPRHAEGRADPGAADLHRHVRHAAFAQGRRGEDGVPGTRAGGAAGAAAE